MSGSLEPQIVACRSILTERPGLIEIPLVPGSTFEAGLASRPVLLLHSCVALDKSLKLSGAELQSATWEHD